MDGMLYGLLTFLGLSVPLLAFKAVRRRYRAASWRRWGATWDKLAAERGGSFRLASVDVFSPAPRRLAGEDEQQARARVVNSEPPALLPVLEIDVDHVAVTARVSLAADTGFLTSFTAEFTAGAGPRFEARARYWNSQLPFLPAHGLAERFTITGASLDVVECAVTDVVEDILVSGFARPHVYSNGLAVSVIAEGFCRDVDALAAGLSSVAKIAASDALALRVLRELPDAELVERDEVTDLPGVELAMPAPVRIGPSQVDDHVSTLAHTPVSRDMNIAIVFDETGEPIGELPDTLPRAALAQLHHAGAGTLTCMRGEAIFKWSGVERHRERLLAGARAVADVARGAASSAYR